MTTHRPISRALVRAAAVCGLAAAVTLAAATPALAHVTAQPGEAEQGGYTKIAFRTPNESPTAGTVKLEVTMPADHPITSVSTTPLPGWAAQVTKQPLAKPIESHGTTITEAPRTVTWTAQPGTRINPGEFVEFEVSMGPLPTDTNQLLFPAVQTYDDGMVVRWDQPPAVEGAPEPEHPAPLVLLVAGSDQGSGSTTAGSAGTTSEASDTTARWLGGAGLLLGAIALGFGIGAFLRARRR